MCFKLHMYKYKYIVVKECYTYSFVVSVDHNFVVMKTNLKNDDRTENKILLG